MFAAGGLITLGLVLLKGDLTAAPNAAVFLPTFDQGNPTHLALQAISLPGIWFLCLLSRGVARLTGRRILAPALWIFGAWLVLRIALIGLAMAFNPG